MTTAYIAKSSFSRIAIKNINDINGEIMDVCKRVYESRDILKYLNHKENSYLKKLMKVLYILLIIPCPMRII